MKPPDLMDIRKREVVRMAVTEYFGIEHSTLFSQTKKRKISFIRMIYVYLLWHYTGLSINHITQELPQHRTIFYHSIKQVNSLCKHYPDVRKQLLEIENKIP